MPNELTADSGALIFATLADVYLSSGMVDEAISILKDGLVRNPTYTLAKIILGRAYFIKGNIEEALKILEGTYEEAQDSENLNLYLGHCYKKIGEPDKAKKYYETTLKIDPENREAQRELEILRSGVPSKPREKKAEEIIKEKVVEESIGEEPKKKKEELLPHAVIVGERKPTFSDIESKLKAAKPQSVVKPPGGEVEPEHREDVTLPEAPEVEPPEEEIKPQEEELEIIHEEEIALQKEPEAMPVEPMAEVIPTTEPEVKPVKAVTPLEGIEHGAIDAIPTQEAVELLPEEPVEVTAPATPFDALDEPIKRLMNINTVKGAFIASKDGLLIQNYYKGRDDIEEICALVAEIYNDVTDSFKILKEEGLERCIIEKYNETICVINAGDTLFTVITQHEAKPGIIFVYARKIIEEIRGILG
jgi:predicted regulator of Ras-like GTPase activity (Roadblock/LC7/MglB family)